MKTSSSFSSHTYLENFFWRTVYQLQSISNKVIPWRIVQELNVTILIFAAYIWSGHMPTFSLYQANMDKLDACKYKPHALTFLEKSENPGGGGYSLI